MTKLISGSVALVVDDEGFTLAVLTIPKSLASDHCSSVRSGRVVLIVRQFLHSLAILSGQQILAHVHRRPGGLSTSTQW